MATCLPRISIKKNKPSDYLRMILFLFFLFLSSYSTAAEEIKNFFSKITVNQDTSLDIEEQITIQAEGDKFKHGLLRFFERNWTATVYENIYNHHTKYQINYILMDGAPVAWTEKNPSLSDDRIKIYIGDPNKKLSPGEHTYTIQYHVDSGVHFYPWGNRFYWDITGSAWTVPIASAKGIITMPSMAKIINLQVFSDDSNQPNSHTIAKIIKDNQAEAESQAIKMGKGLIVLIDTKGGFPLVPAWVAREGTHETIANIITASTLFLIIILTISSLLQYLKTKGPDKKAYIEQPLSLSPAEVAYILERGYSDDILNYTIIDMIARGILSVDSSNKNEKSLILKRNNTPRAEPFEEQKKIINILFADSDTFELKIENKKIIEEAASALEDYLDKDVQKKYYTLLSDFLFTPIFLLSFLSIFSLRFYGNLHWILIIICTILCWIPSVMNWQGSRRKLGFWRLKTLGLFSAFVISTLFFATLFLGALIINPALGLFYSLTYILLIGLTQLGKLTPLGQAATEKIDQLRQKIQSMNLINMTVENYRSLVSYAMIFDLNEKLDNQLAKMAPLPADLNDIMICIDRSKSHGRRRASFFINGIISSSAGNSGGSGGRGGGGGGGGW